MAARGWPIAAIGASVILWSFAYVLSGWALETGSPAVLSVSRFGLALVVLIPLAVRRPAFVRTLRQPRTILLGLTGVTLYYSLANIGLLFTTPGTAALVVSLLPVLTAIAAVVMIGERLSLRTVIGLILASLGVALVAASGFRFDLGVVLNIGALAVTPSTRCCCVATGGDRMLRTRCRWPPPPACGAPRSCCPGWAGRR
ncbi:MULTISPECIES: DMT family transporter [Microbacterium]|uniref:DMT family transporter n=1 Tax=Microbacterium TaxID=33882 RepID=UPI0014322E2C|nr:MULTISPECIES: DMT family transporter [Microbacterium]MCK6067148.1 DMT family transporter [Microbacterium sp. EYE_512]